MAWMLLALLAAGMERSSGAEAVISKEYQVKAAFLYNFTKFVEWPEEKFTNASSPIVIGVLGRNPFGVELAEMIKDRKVNGHGIQFKQIDMVSEVKGLHVLFVSGGETNRFEGLEAALKEGSVLGVGESEAFLKRGGVIVFALEGDKVRFEIDMNSAASAKLKISAQLQKLARMVRKKP